MRLFTVLVNKGLELLFAHPGVLLPHPSNAFDNPGIYTLPSDPCRLCRMGNQCLKTPIMCLEPFLPYMDQLSVDPKGLLCRSLPIGVVKPQYPLPLLGPCTSCNHFRRSSL